MIHTIITIMIYVTIGYLIAQIVKILHKGRKSQLTYNIEAIVCIWPIVLFYILIFFYFYVINCFTDFISNKINE